MRICTTGNATNNNRVINGSYSNPGARGTTTDCCRDDCPVRQTHCKGFSLIELMVVLFIIAIIVGGVSQVIRPQGSLTKRINQQGESLFAQMQFALDDALVRHQALGIVLQQNDSDSGFSREYAWYRHDGENWILTGKPLGQQSLPEELMWSIEVEEVSVEESLDALLEEEDGRVRPVIIFSPDGEVTDFSMVIYPSDQTLLDNPEAVDQRYRITLNERGELAGLAVGESE